MVSDCSFRYILILQSFPAGAEPGKLFNIWKLRRLCNIFRCNNFLLYATMKSLWPWYCLCNAIYYTYILTKCHIFYENTGLVNYIELTLSSVWLGLCSYKIYIISPAERREIYVRTHLYFPWCWDKVVSEVTYQFDNV